MIRRDAINVVAKTLDNDTIAVSANGYISRDLSELQDRTSNFYMIGSMGLASSIGLGLAIKNPKKQVFVFDGDGNILMNLGSLVTIGSIKPTNLVHCIFDNSSHESTGGQPTNSSHVKIEKIAKAANYNVFRINSQKSLESVLKKIRGLKGPILILVEIEKNNQVSKRIGIEPTLIKTRFMNSINN